MKVKLEKISEEDKKQKNRDYAKWQNKKQLLVDEALAKKLQEDKELQHQKQMEQVMEEENRLENLWQEESERKLAEEFERMQK